MFADWKIKTNEKGNSSSVEWLIRILLFSLLVSLWLTHKAWIPVDVDYPRVPLLPFFDPEFPIPFLLVNFILIHVCAIAILTNKRREVALPLLLIAFLLFFIDDIDRFQPWIFVHLPMLVLLVRKGDSAIGLVRWGMAFMYFWGGVHKLNQNFAWEVFPYFMKPFGWNELFYLPSKEIGSYPLPSINHIAWIIPATEILIAFFILIPAFRRIGIVAGVAMHVFTVFILGPLGHNWNSVVWVWNVELLILLFLLFGKEIPTFRASLTELKTGRAAIVFTFFMGIAPVFWYSGYYPHALSYHLYSGYNPQVNFWFDKETSVRMYTMPDGKSDIDFSKVNKRIMDSKWVDFTFYDVERDESFIMADHYAMQELNVPIFAEEFYFRILGKKLCDCFGFSGDDAGIRMELRSKFSARITEKQISCRELLNSAQ